MSMNVPRSSLRSFLASAKASLHNAIINRQKVTIVTGNESADLDSITSAILFAYLQTSYTTSPLANKSVNKHTPPSQYPPFYIPLINIPKEDLHIRPELLTLLPYANIEQSHLITLDDLSVEAPAGLDPSGREQLQPQFTQLVLVDHNKLDGPLADKGFDDRIIGCIDHHVDEKTVPDDAKPRIIERCGSCTSLVTRYCRPAWDALSEAASSAGQAISGQSDAVVGIDDDAVRRTWDAQLAKLAIASVLIDTRNLQDPNKVTDNDRQAVEYLEAKILLAPGAKWDRDAFFEQISSAKKDLSKLTPGEILRKDYKQYKVKGQTLGISAVVQTLSWQIEKAGGVDEYRKVMHQYAQQKKLDLHAIMTTSTSDEGNYQRELLFRSVDASHNPVIDAFTKKNQEKLGLKPWEEKEGLGADFKEGGHVTVWWQKEIQFTRKTIAPLMIETINES